MDTELQERMKLVPLGPWLDLCKEAGVPYVPAEFSPVFPVKQITAALDGEPTPEMDAAFEWYKRAVETAFLKEGSQISARWECCSSSDAKYAASKGAEWGTPYWKLMVDDPRVSDCTVGLTTRLCVRPWVETCRQNGYPVEFRLFYGPDGFLGISDYYPQRGGLSDLVGGVRLRPHDLGWVADNGLKLWVSRAFPVGFSADFLLTSAGEIVFLEGGPPHVEGPISAHPCCFPPGRVSGVALAPMEGALTR